MLLSTLLACRTVGFDLEVDLFAAAPPVTSVPTSSPFEVALFDERPTAELPAFLDLEEFGPVLVADRVRLAEGDGFLEVTVADVVFEVDAPLTLTFDVQSLDGRWHLLGDEAGGYPDACTFEVDASTGDAAQATALRDCLRAVTTALGGADDFHVTVSGTTADDDWEYRATYTLGTDRPVELSCTGALGISAELREQAGSAELVIEELSLAGYAAAQDQAMSAVAFATTWVEGDPPLAGASGTTRAEAGEGRFVGSVVEVAEAVPGSIVFAEGDVAPVSAWPADWAALAMETLLEDGSIEACDVRIHDAVPNRSFVELALVGTGEASRE